MPQALKKIEHIIVVKNEKNNLIGFKGIENTKLEMLFIKDSERGKGIGKKLLQYGIEKYNINELTVNEQNPNAQGLYEHMGFKTYKRTKLDEQGNTYSILYMRLENDGVS